MSFIRCEFIDFVKNPDGSTYNRSAFDPTAIWKLIDSDFEIEYQVYNSHYNFVPYTIDFLIGEYSKRNLNIEANIAAFLLYNSNAAYWTLSVQLRILKEKSIRFKSIDQEKLNLYLTFT